MRTLFFILLLIPSSLFAQKYANGTLVFSSSSSIIGRIARNVTDGDQYTHIAIIIDDMVYESTYPKSIKTPVDQYGMKTWTMDFYVPTTPFSDDEVGAMRYKAESELGKPYQLRNYFNPKSPKTKGTWCSRYVGAVLNYSGSFNFTNLETFEPQNMVRKIWQRYKFQKRIRK